MNIRNLQTIVESHDASRWEAKWDQDAFDSAIQCEAEAIADRKLNGSPLYALKVMERDDLELDTMIDADRKLDWQMLKYQRLFGSMPQSEFIETLAKWVAQNDDDIQREARGNIEGDMYDNLYDADDQWGDA